jgi:two-component system CheB/CheR fusion protein
VKKIVALLRSRTGIDFSEYKQSTVLRRIERRIGIVNVGSIDEYLQYMQQFEQEVFKLEKDLLISVTRFFRDPEAFAALREDVIPAILEKASCGEAIRIWIPACASGEEAYTIAMLFNEAKDTLGKTIDLKIFATDVDKAALSHASAGVYPKNIEEEVPPELLARYFVAQGDVYHICERVRKMVIFARQDILRDPPFVKVDLISCRNLLIYLQFPFQQKVLSLLHFALRPGAFLMLGISETVGEKQELFETVNKKARIFKKREDSVASIAGVVSRTPGEAGHLESPPGPTPERRAHTERAQQEKLLSTVSEKLIADYAPTCFVLNEKHEILQSFGQTRRYIELPPGRFTRDILSLLPPPLALALSGIFRRMQDEQRIISYRGVRFDRDGVAATVDLRVEPMPAMRGQPPSILVFVEEPKPSPPDGEVHQFDVSCHSAERIADLEYDLRDTREQLQQAIEEKETANEELQAANEELLASNEELQSTNEELESVNEELSTLNAEFQEKISELTQANDDLENVLSASNIAFIFLDGDLRIRRFTTAVTREINLVQHDAGRRLTDIRSPLIDAIAEDLPRVASSSECVTKTVEPAPGSRCLLTITPFRRMGASNQGLVITILNTADGTPS